MMKSVLFPPKTRRICQQVPVGVGWLLLAQSGLFQSEGVQAQITPDQTLGAEKSTIDRNVQVRGALGDRIGGGAQRGVHLFHSFSEFGVERDQRVYFSNPSGVENILSRVTGSNRSDILGKLGVDGSANLFLINPNGIFFGPNAQLDVSGSFVAGTSDRILFNNGESFSARNPQAPPLVEVNIPIGLQMGLNPPSALRNEAALVAGKNLQLTGGDVVSVGSIAAPQGHIKVEATLGNAEVQQLTAKSATIEAKQNVILNSSQLTTTNDLAIVAGNTVHIRDSQVTPVQIQAGGDLTLQGNQQIDILALNHPTTPFQAGGNLSLISDGLISGDAHFSSGGNFSILNRAGQPGTFLSFYDPIVRSGGNVTFGAYTGRSLKVEAAGSIVASAGITITGADCVTGSDGCAGGIPADDPDRVDLTTSPALIMRSGVAVGSPNVPIAAEGTNFAANPPGTANPGNITVNDINVGNGSSGTLILEARNGGSINFNGTTVTTNGGQITTRGNVNFNNGTVTGAIAGSESAETFTFNGGTVVGSIAGGGGAGVNTLQFNNGTNTWAVTGENSGTVNSISFSQFANLTGGAGADTFNLSSTGNVTEAIDGGTGNNTLVRTSAALTTWNIDAPNAGNISGVNFTNFSNLTGGTGDDHFIFANNSAEITGAIAGGGGTNRLDFGATTSDRTINLSNLNSIQNVIAGSGQDTIVGSNNSETFTITSNNAGTIGTTTFTNIEAFEGRDGTDTIVGAAGNDVFNLSAPDTVTSSGITFREMEVIDGDDGVNNGVIGSGDDDIFSLNTVAGGFQLVDIQSLDGGGGNNRLQGSDASDLFNIDGNNQGQLNGTIAFSNIQRLEGLGGDDRFQIQRPAGQIAAIDGGSGDNTLDYSGNVEDIIVNFDTATATGVTGFSSVNSIVGGNSNDTVIGTNGNDTITIANNNIETFEGVRVSGVENLQGLDGNDNFRFNNGATLGGTVQGGAGADRLDYNNYTTSINVDLQNLTATGIAGGFTGIEAVRGGSAANDTLIGTNGNDVFEFNGTVSTATIAFSNIEILRGNGGTNDILRGSVGNDTFTLTGGLSQGNVNDNSIVFNDIDSLQGGQGNDTFNFRSIAPMTLNAAGNEGNDTFNFRSIAPMTLNAAGNEGNDTFNLSSGTTVTGTLQGDEDADTFNLNQGSVTSIAGGTGNDRFNLNSGTFTGTILGNAGDDTLSLNGGTSTGQFTGGAHRDTVEGTTGNDLFNVTGINSATHSSISFSEVETIDGRAGSSDTVIGRDNENDIFSLGNLVVGGFQIIHIEVLNGGAGSGTDTLIASDGDDTLKITANKAGSIAGLSFQEIEAFEGRGGNDTIVDETGNNTFTLTSANTLTASNINFSEVETINAADTGNDTVIGTNNDEVFTITGNNAGIIGAFSFQNIEIFQARGGSNDTIVGTASNDTFTLNLDNTLTAANINFSQIERIDAADGNDTVIGTNNNETFTITDNKAGTIGTFSFQNIEELQGRDGSEDKIVGTASNDTFTLNLDNTLTAANINFSQIERIDAADGNDTVIGTDNDETFTITGNKAGTIGTFSFQNIEELQGGDGNDDTIVGNTGNDTFTLITSNTVESSGISFSEMERLDGGDGDNNTVIGTDTDNRFSLGISVDGFLITRIQTLDGRSGNDTLIGTVNFDVVSLGNEAKAGTIEITKAGTIEITKFKDIEIFEGRDGTDRVVGTTADDIFNLTDINQVAVNGITFKQVERIDGNNPSGDNDRLFGIPDAENVIEMNSTFTTNSGFQVINIESITGGNKNDTFTMLGGTIAEIKGEAGNDRLNLQGGSVTKVLGGGGDDVVQLSDTGEIKDFFDGEAGTDTLNQSGGTVKIFNGGQGNDIANISNGTVTNINGNEDDDTITVSGGTVTTIVGAAGKDTLNQSGGTVTTFNGGIGQDHLKLTGGTIAVVNGGEDDDSFEIQGGTGITISGDDGNDKMFLSNSGNVTTFNGNNGNDELNLNSGTIATFNGGEGSDGVNLAGGRLTTFNGQNNDDIVQVIGNNPSGSIDKIDGGTGNLVLRGDLHLNGLPTISDNMSDKIVGSGKIIIAPIATQNNLGINHTNGFTIGLTTLSAVSNSFTSLEIGNAQTGAVSIGAIDNTVFRIPTTIQGRSITTQGDFAIAGLPLNLIAHSGDITIAHQLSSTVIGNAIGDDVNLRGQNINLNKGTITTKTTGTGKGSTIILNATQAINLKEASKISAIATGSGASGSIRVTAPVVSLTGNTQALKNSGTPQPYNLNNSDRSEITIHSASANATTGNLQINAGQLNLESSALIVKRSNGVFGDSQGNIRINFDPSLTIANSPSNLALRTANLKEESLIAAIGSGQDTFSGDITFEGFALVQAGSVTGTNGNDIVSLSDRRGREGIIAIRGGSEGGFQRTRPEVGDRRNTIFGNQVNAADADAGRDLDRVTTEFVDPNKLVGQECRVQTDDTASTLTIASRGGLPSNPLAPLNAEPETSDWIGLQPAPTSPSLQALAPERLSKISKTAQKQTGQCFASFTAR